MWKKILITGLLVLLARSGLVAPLAACGQSGTAPASPVGETATPKKVALLTRFIGNSHLADHELQKAAALELQELAKNGYRDALADDAAFQMEIAHRRAGFAFATVDYAASGHEQQVLLSFTVNEGPRVLMEKLNFAGNVAFSSDTLLAFFVGRGTGLFGLGQQVFVESDLNEAISAVRDLYYSKGYLNITIKEPLYSFSPNRDRVTVTLPIVEGSRIIISAIEYDGDLLPEAQEFLDQAAAAQVGEPFFRRRKLMLKSRVQEIYGNLGFPDATIELREKLQNDEIILICAITSGPRITISTVSITGNKRTQESFILDRLALKSGEPFSLSKKRETFHNLYQTGLFPRVAIDFPPGDSDTSRTLAIDVEEAPARELFFHVGWGSYELLRGGTGFQDSNLFGRGRTFRLEADASFRSEKIQATVIDPWLLGHDITADIPVYFIRREEPSFTRQEVGSSVLLTKKMSKTLEITLAYLYKETNILEIIADPDVENAESSYTVASAKAQATWDNRNDLFFPTKGHKYYGMIEVAEPAIGSDLSFWRVGGGMRHFRKIAAKTTLGWRYDTGLIVPGRNQVTIPLGERFFNGGENTVRSFQESELGPKDLSGDPVGGMAYNVAGIELRQQLGNNTAATLFVEYGNISPNRSRAEQNKTPYTSRSEVIRDTRRDYFSDFRPALGTGLLYLLPIGPMRLDFAWNPDRDAERRENELTIHFSIGMAF